jgi:hypothetical protein
MTAPATPAPEVPTTSPLQLVVVRTPQPPLDDERTPLRLVLPGVTVPPAAPSRTATSTGQRRGRTDAGGRLRPHLVQPRRPARRP